MATSAHAIQVNGKWFDIEEVQAGVPIKTTRTVSGFTSVDGYEHRYQSPTSMRQWTLTFPANSTPDVVSMLQLAANGKGGSVRFFDYTEASVNMFDPTKTTGPDTGTMLNVGAALIPLPSVTNGVAYTVTNLLRAGKIVTLSLWSTAAAAAVIGTYNIGAGNVNIVAPAGSGSRLMSVSFTPATEQTLTVTIASTTVATALRLIEGTAADSGTWLDGRSMPCAVSVRDPDRSLNIAGTSGAHAQSAFSVVIEEVAPW